MVRSGDWKHGGRGRRWLGTLVIACALGLGFSSAGAEPPRPVSSEPFEHWLKSFRGRAVSSGISGETWDRSFRGVRPNPEVVERDGRQPEFSQPIWEYLDRAVSQMRIENGRRELARKAEVLARLETTYGVDRHILLAIWGLESAYGHNCGDLGVIESLATLAHHGRRRAFAEGELLAALEIIQTGDISPERMVGSWAGAMGHTQFIPTSFLSYAVDFGGDGRRDIWADDALDALASTANYLSSYGWSQGQSWGMEVSLPENFDYGLADGADLRSVSFWRALGVRGQSGLKLPVRGRAAILIPAGVRGPAFAVFDNFFVIKRYNNATSYALAVGHLALRIGGGKAFAASWPREDRALRRSEREEIQRHLTTLGFSVGGVDGNIGPHSRRAIRAFQRSRAQVPDGYDSAKLLEQLRSLVRAEG